MSEFASLVFYLICFFVCSVLFVFYYKYKKRTNAILFVIIAVLLLALLMGVRGNVGTDCDVYEDMFNYTRNHNWNMNSYDVFKNVEYGFLGLVKLISFFPNQVIWIIITILFFYFSLKSILEYKEKKEFSLLIAWVYLLVFFYTNLFNITRQALAFSICLYAMKYLFESKKEFFIYVLVAASIHKSALLVLIFWFFWNHKENKMISINKQRMYISVVFTISVTYRIVLSFLMKLPFLSFLQKYEYTLDVNRGGNKTFILYVIFAIVGTIFSKKLKSLDKRNAMYIFLLYLNLAFGIAALSNKFIYRITMYFQMGYVLLFPYLPCCFRKDSRIGGKVIMIFFAIIYFILIYYISKNAEIIPYQFYWET